MIGTDSKTWFSREKALDSSEVGFDMAVDMRSYSVVQLVSYRIVFVLTVFEKAPKAVSSLHKR
jgi:hypothetical protein